MYCYLVSVVLNVKQQPINQQTTKHENSRSVPNSKTKESRVNGKWNRPPTAPPTRMERESEMDKVDNKNDEREGLDEARTLYTSNEKRCCESPGWSLSYKEDESSPFVMNNDAHLFSDCALKEDDQLQEKLVFDMQHANDMLSSPQQQQQQQ
ncbi:hypothetical protein RFI_37149 [Reticulomyxa filosa]|uniref:Uncharacterized protein n=1 Tax=Reticulomyxa filosa TaxID=46433 RepID=X6LE68_RETFI|nr:hypothetical protein RFI_37149 [Reticulomyxa filosa]|eukprot:ETO00298.1 hypothetical protein RFI_37149 [Reticulomyxa filosa]